MKVALVQVIRGKDAEGANRLLQCLAKAADLLQLDGVQAVAVRPLLSKHMGTAPAGKWRKRFNAFSHATHGARRLCETDA
jgi:hypothetical protein